MAEWNMPFNVDSLLQLKGNDDEYLIPGQYVLLGGFYYISDTNEDETEYFGMKYDAYLSYYPLTDELRDVSNQIEKLLTQEFPEFDKFDSKWADYPIENIQSYYSFKEKTMLFELIFEEQPGGIFF